MARCKDCINYGACKVAELNASNEVEIWCELFKDRSIFIKLPDINRSVNEQLSEHVKGLFDIAKASGNSSNILQVLSECFAQSAEQAKQTLNGSEENA